MSVKEIYSRSHRVVGKLLSRVPYNFKVSSVHNAHISNNEYHTARLISLVHTDKFHEFQRSTVLQISSGIHLPNAPFFRNMFVRRVTLRHNPNKFGNLSDDYPVEVINDGDKVEDAYITYPVPRNQQLRIKQYADIIKAHLSKKEIEAAVDVLETRMIKEDRVKPDAYIYSLVISACGRFGHTKKAFQLYKQMKERALKVPGAVYTALFNACANSVSSEEGLRRALYLQNVLFEKGIDLNATHYHAMMKAFGRCGDLSRAFEAVDSMIDKQVVITEETFNFLLQACVTDKKTGFKYALLVWQKMLQKNINPTLYSFNLLLRCIRDCGIGEYQEVEKMLQHLVLDAPATSPKISACHSTSQVTSADSETPVETKPEVESSVSSWQYLPDLLSPTPSLSCDISSLDLRKPHERLFLLGGYSKFVSNMEKFGVTPNIKTYTLLLDCIPPTIFAEQRLLSKVKKEGLSIDTEFCNALIKKRSFRFDYQNAKDVLRLIKREKLQPDIITFGVLSLACRTVDEAKELIRDMRQAGYRINVEILGAMLRQGCIQHNFKYVMKILYLSQEENIKPSAMFMENIKCLIASSREILQNKSQDADANVSLQNKNFKKEFTTFMYKYQGWLKKVTAKENECKSTSH